MYFMMYPPGGAAQLSAVPSGVGLVSRPKRLKVPGFYLGVGRRASSAG